MQSLSTAEKAWIWCARLLGGATFVYVVLILQGNFPTPGYVLIGGLLGGEFVFRASKKVDE